MAKNAGRRAWFVWLIRSGVGELGLPGLYRPAGVLGFPCRRPRFGSWFGPAGRGSWVSLVRRAWSLAGVSRRPRVSLVRRPAGVKILKGRETD